VRGRFGAQSLNDRLKHSVHVIHDVTIPKSYSSIVVLAKPTVAHAVAGIIAMLAAIDFDH
jgi:hypothetical protein